MYADLNEEKTQIVARYGVGQNPKHVSFSENSSHEDYVGHGYYKIINESPKAMDGKKLGERIFVVDEDAKTVDISREVVDKTRLEKRSDRKDSVRPLKLAGVDLGGIMASATKSDQDGLTAVSVVVIMARAAGSTFEDTNFEFANGSELLITDSNFDGYFAAWSVFRQSFFKPEAV